MSTTSPSLGNTEAQTPAPAGPSSRNDANPNAPLGFKFVKVRKDDGTIITVKRKLTADELPPENSASTIMTIAPSATKPGAEFKIVTVRKPDGTLIKVRRPIKKEDVPAEGSKGSLAQNKPVSETREVTTESSTPDPAPEAKPKDKNVLPEKDSIPAQPLVRETKGSVLEEKPSQDKPTTVPKALTETKEPTAVPESTQEALEAQKAHFRDGKRHRFKTTLLRGIAVVAGTAVPAIEIGDLMDGDEVLSDDDWSIDEDHDHDHHGDDDDVAHEQQADYDHGHSFDDDDSKTLEHSGGGTCPIFSPNRKAALFLSCRDQAHANNQPSDSSGHITIDAGAAVQGAGLAMAAAASQPPPRQPVPVPAAAAGATSVAEPNKAAAEKEKITYKINAKDLNQMEEKTAEKASRPLKKHWANITFYIMASLSIVLPLLFLRESLPVPLAGSQGDRSRARDPDPLMRITSNRLLVLGLFIILMKGKSISSRWGSMQDAIKIAVSAWPIVFAAVVAQVFKAWATYKVERGIKLMELEQLVGSNSFGSAIKQPFLLRRLDLLTLLLVAIWCLSPLGSQALQRTYTIDYAMVQSTMPVYYLDMTSSNRIYSIQNLGVLIHTGSDSILQQKLSMTYQSLFLPPAVRDRGLEDKWNRPKPTWLDPAITQFAPYSTSEFGIPVIVTESIFDASVQVTPRDATGRVRSETITFPVTSSYFEFTCGNWSVVNGSYFDDAANLPEFAKWSTSVSKTAHYHFYADNGGSEINRMKFASLIKSGSTAKTGASALPTSGNESLHSFIECGFKQRFVDFDVQCYMDTNTAAQVGIPDCEIDDYTKRPAVRETPPASLKNTSGAHLLDMSSEFALYTSPNLATLDPVTTPSKCFRLAVQPHSVSALRTTANRSAQMRSFSERTLTL